MGHKGQSSIMEYMLMAFFMLFVIVVIIFFLGWWQFSQLGAEQESLKIRESDVLMNRLINSPLFVIENSVFDDSRLMSMQSLGTDLCDDLSPIFGDRWFLELESLNPEQVYEEAICQNN